MIQSGLMQQEHSKGPGGLEVNAVGPVGSQVSKKDLKVRSVHAREDRRHPLESMNYWDTEKQPGLKSRSRSNAIWESSVKFWSNCAVSLVKQLWNGNLNDDLIQASTGRMNWDLSVGGGDGVLLSQCLKVAQGSY